MSEDHQGIDLKPYIHRFAAPSHLQYRIREALQNEIHSASVPAPAPKRHRLFDLPWVWINFGVATVSSVAFAVTFALLLNAPTDTEQLDQEIVASHFRSLMPNHLADVISTDRHTVKPWFAGKLDFSPVVIDFSKNDFPLIGGRLDYIHQRPVAALVYKHKQHVLNLYSWPEDGNTKLQGQKVSEIKGFHIIAWNQTGMNYRLISDLNEQESMQFQRLLSAQIANAG